MVGALIRKLLVSLGWIKAPVARRAAPAADDDFVARHGLSYGSAADPISPEARRELERLKSLPRNRR